MHDLVRTGSKGKKAFITLCSPVVPLLSTSKADSGLASEFRWDRAIYTAYERMLKAYLASMTHEEQHSRPRPRFCVALLRLFSSSADVDAAH
jgi:hypothetical protein